MATATPREASSHSNEAFAEGPVSSGAGRLWLLTAILIVLAAIAGFWTRRRRPVTAKGDHIDVVSVKALGGRHRLLIVQAAGERLLLSASEKELRLLKTLGSDNEPTDFGEALDAAVAHDDATDEPEDVAGLLRLRASLKGHDRVTLSGNRPQAVA